VNVAITAAHRVGFFQAFGKGLISAEHALPQGLRISRLSFVRTSTTSDVDLSAWQQTPNRTAQGGLLEIFGKPIWGTASLQSWATSAAPAIQAVLVKLLSPMAQSMPGSPLVVSVLPGPTSVTSSYMHAQFAVFAQVPALRHTMGGRMLTHDPLGTIYQARAQSFEGLLSSLGSSREFAALLPVELSARGVPDLPGMSFSSGPHTSTDVNATTTASGTLPAIVLIVAAISAFLCCCGVKCRKKCRKKPTAKIDIEKVGDDTVKSFDDGEDLCVCGSHLPRDVSSCNNCCRTSGDIARERYIETRTLTELAQSSSPINRGAREAVDLMTMIGARVSGVFGNELCEASTGLGGTKARKSKCLDNDRRGKAAQEDAESLRLAMGGVVHHPNASGADVNAGTRKIHRSSTDVSNGLTRTPSTETASSSSGGVKESRMIAAFREFRQPGDNLPFNTLSMGGPVSPSMSNTVGYSAVGRGSPAETRSATPSAVGRSSSHESNSKFNSDMEVVDVTDSSSEGEVP